MFDFFLVEDFAKYFPEVCCAISMTTDYFPILHFFSKPWKQVASNHLELVGAIPKNTKQQIVITPSKSNKT